MRLFLAATLLVTCTASLRAQSMEERPELSIRLPSYRGVVQLDSLETVRVVPAPPDAVIPRLRAVFAGWNVHPSLDDSTAGLLGVVNALHLSFSHLWMSQLFDCGTDMTGPVADHSRLRISVVTFVRPVPGDSSRVGIAALAVAQPNGGAWHEDIVCRSTSYLETHLWQAAAQ